MRIWLSTRKLLFFVELILVSFSTYATASDQMPTDLKLFWSVPMTVTSSNKETGISFRDAAVTSDGQVVFLATLVDSVSRKTVLLKSAEQGTKRDVINLELHGKTTTPFWERIFSGINPRPSVKRLAVDSRDTIWLGGDANRYLGLASDPHGDAYLAKLDGAGKPLWENAYKVGNDSTIVGMSPTSAGNMIVVTRDLWHHSSWIAAIEADKGQIIWEKWIGNGKQIAIASLSPDTFMIVGSAETGVGNAYKKKYVFARTLNADGVLGPEVILREDLNEELGSVAEIRITSSSDGVYVFSSLHSTEADQQKPHEVARVSPDGSLLWRKKLTDVFLIHGENERIVQICEWPTVSVLPNGDGLVACTFDRQVHLLKLDKYTGNYKQTSLPLTVCDGNKHATSLFSFILKDRQIGLASAPFDSGVAPTCSWTGQLVVGK